MHFLYGSKPGVTNQLVATFDSEQQLLAYVRWATLSQSHGISKFEQGSALAGYHSYSYDQASSTQNTSPDILHNPSPSML